LVSTAVTTPKVHAERVVTLVKQLLQLFIVANDENSVVIERKSQVVSRIIPGNWGKVESGWLARPLLSRIARFGSGGRIHQFLWPRSHAVSIAK
jgi:hypothetical protein